MYHPSEKIYTKPDLRIDVKLKAYPKDVLKVIGDLRNDYTWYNPGMVTKFLRENPDEGTVVFEQTDNTIPFLPLTTHETQKVIQNGHNIEIQLAGKHKTNPKLFSYKSRYLLSPTMGGSKLTMYVVFEGMVAHPWLKPLVTKFYKGVLQKAFERLNNNFINGYYNC